MMIDVDHNHTIGLMQSQDRMPLSCSSVNHLQLSTTTDSNSSIYENNYHQKKFISSSRVRINFKKFSQLTDAIRLSIHSILSLMHCIKERLCPNRIINEL